MLMLIKLPHDEFNDAVEEGDVGDTLEKIFKDAEPEAVYFTELDGQRSVMMVVDVGDASQIPKYAEPWFLSFNADVEFKIAMTPEDLKRANLGKLSEKWG
jgi:hypothetical protein